MPALQMLDNLVPISDFSHGKGSAAFSKVGDDNPVVVLNKPAFVIVTPDEYREAKQAEEDLTLLTLALKRMAVASDDALVSLSDVMEELGVSQDELDQMDEVEFE